MSVFKRKGKWYVYIRYPDGTRFRRAIGTKKQAEQVEQRIKSEIAAGQWDLKQSMQVTFTTLVEEYLEYAEMSKAASTYSADYSRITHRILPFFQNTPIRQMTPQMVDSYKTQRLQEGAAPKTINNELLNLSHIMKMGVRWRYVDHNVVSEVEKMKVPKNPPQFLSQDEIEQLVEAARSSHIYPLIMTALHTGMRKSELLNLRWADIDFGMQTITVQSKQDWHTKSYKARVVQMTPGLYEVLWEQASKREHDVYVFTFRGVPIRKDVRRSLGKLARKAGLEGLTLHLLRHTFASQLVMAGVSLRDVQELMGHQSYDTTLRYAHLAPDHVKRQVLRLPFAGSRPPVGPPEQIISISAEQEKRREGARRKTL